MEVPGRGGYRVEWEEGEGEGRWVWVGFRGVRGRLGMWGQGWVSRVWFGAQMEEGRVGSAKDKK